MGSLILDLPYTLRTVSNNPGFAVVAVLTLALRPLPVKNPGRVVRLFRTHSARRAQACSLIPSISIIAIATTCFPPSPRGPGPAPSWARPITPKR